VVAESFVRAAAKFAKDNEDTTVERIIMIVYDKDSVTQQVSHINQINSELTHYIYDNIKYVLIGIVSVILLCVFCLSLITD